MREKNFDQFSFDFRKYSVKRTVCEGTAVKRSACKTITLKANARQKNYHQKNGSFNRGISLIEILLILVILLMLLGMLWRDLPHWTSRVSRRREPDTNRVILSCVGGHITDLTWRKILAEKEPFTLFLSRITNPDTDLEQLTNCENLRTLHIHRGSGLTSAALPIIARIPNLEDLRINVSPISGETLGALVNAKNLVHLEFSPYGNQIITDDQIAKLASCEKLQFLEINGQGITEECLTALVTLKNLKKIGIGIDLTDVGIKSLAQLKSLKEISAAGEQITDSGIAQLASLPNLEKIALYRCPQISGEGFAALNQLTELKSIQLYKSGITDDGLKSLAMLSNLESLEIISSGSFTEKGLEDLAKLPHLRSLILLTDIDISPEFLKQLRKKMPLCEIKLL